MKKMDFPTDYTTVQFLISNSKPKLHLLYVWCSFLNFEAEFHANALFFRSAIITLWLAFNTHTAVTPIEKQCLTN